MGNERRLLWILWAALCATLVLYAAIPHYFERRGVPWYEGQTAVVSFVLALIALVAGVGTFAIRESWVRRPQASGALDVASAQGRARVRGAFVTAWALCDAVGVLGLLVALGSNDASRATPFLLGAAALFAIHRPSAWVFDAERAA